MIYTVQVKNQKVNWDEIEPIEITHYPWGTTYMPKTSAWLYRIEDVGFCLKMRCEEKEPKAIYTQANDPVYKDSCMEFFANYYPEEDAGYINFEMNSKGAILCEYGIPGDRFYLRDKGFEVPQPVVKKDEDYWEVELMILDTFLKAVYHKDTPPSKMTGNFFKCGDETHTPHYGSWSPINHPVPAFHKPEFFGDLIIK